MKFKNEKKRPRVDPLVQKEETEDVEVVVVDEDSENEVIEEEEERGSGQKYDEERVLQSSEELLTLHGPLNFVQQTMDQLIDSRWNTFRNYLSLLTEDLPTPLAEQHEAKEEENQNENQKRTRGPLRRSRLRGRELTSTQESLRRLLRDEKRLKLLRNFHRALISLTRLRHTNTNLRLYNLLFNRLLSDEPTQTSDSNEEKREGRKRRRELKEQRGQALLLKELSSRLVLEDRRREVSSFNSRHRWFRSAAFRRRERRIRQRKGNPGEEEDDDDDEEVEDGEEEFLRQRKKLQRQMRQERRKLRRRLLYYLSGSFASSPDSTDVNPSSGKKKESRGSRKTSLIKAAAEESKVHLSTSEEVDDDDVKDTLRRLRDGSYALDAIDPLPSDSLVFDNEDHFFNNELFPSVKQESSENNIQPDDNKEEQQQQQFSEENGRQEQRFMLKQLRRRYAKWAQLPFFSLSNSLLYSYVLDSLKFSDVKKAAINGQFAGLARILLPDHLARAEHIGDEEFGMLLNLASEETYKILYQKRSIERKPTPAQKAGLVPFRGGQESGAKVLKDRAADWRRDLVGINYKDAQEERRFHTRLSKLLRKFRIDREQHLKDFSVFALQSKRAGGGKLVSKYRLQFGKNRNWKRILRRSRFPSYAAYLGLSFFENNILGIRKGYRQAKRLARKANTTTPLKKPSSQEQQERQERQERQKRQKRQEQQRFSVGQRQEKQDNWTLQPRDSANRPITAHPVLNFDRPHIGVWRKLLPREKRLVLRTPVKPEIVQFYKEKTGKKLEFYN